jgi:hypothetical protein
VSMRERLFKLLKKFCSIDVINISMGFDDMPLETNPFAIASFRAVKKGVVVSTSAGNNGSALGTVHTGFPWVLTVTAGSVDDGWKRETFYRGENEGEAVIEGRDVDKFFEKNLNPSII